MVTDERPEYGFALRYDDDTADIWKVKGFASREAWLAAMSEHLHELQQSAERELPPNTVYEIRTKIPTNFGQNLGIAWYSNPSMQGKPTTQMERYPGTLNQLGGYFLMGVCKTPEKSHAAAAT